MDKSTRFHKFTVELAELSKKYGIAIQATGGVYIYDHPKDLVGIRYTNDHTSHDLYYDLPNERHF